MLNFKRLFMIRDTGIDDSKQDLIEIAKLPKSKQIEVVEKVLDGEVSSAKGAIFQDQQEEVFGNKLPD